MNERQTGSGHPSLPASLASGARPAIRRRLALPAAVDRRRIVWRYAIPVALYHLLALLAFLPWFFSWTGVALAVLGLYVFGTLGINLYYHRLLTHRGLVVPRPVERVLAILGVCCLQDAPARWVAVHRRHHEHADERPDPHSPLAGFLWSHVGWMLVENADLARLHIYERYAKDIVRDRFQRRLERSYGWINLASWLAFYGAGLAAGLLAGWSVAASAQFGASLLVWGVFVRTVLVWHITWSVNSASHLWGYRSHETGEDSRNNVLVALISNGEGWHNNHHADPRSARHGHRWWELDVTWLTIRLMGRLGLAGNIAGPRRRARPAPP
ncbi:fatty acid desaturase [Roseomonas sp. NAR14]|uniref:Fatty acid desaturase n=1 Tax=Roseomonas acroporae TaxID=2937791 RepID=A0A9X1YDL3_9PROT|nr:fatty acid desaturase [Roseomonas acroporae]MCK8786767.1 fatty acid desaturase [Roseomonas acroporae]